MAYEFKENEKVFLEESSKIEGYDFTRRPLTREIKTVKANGEKAYIFLMEKMQETKGVLYEPDLLKCHALLMGELLGDAGSYRKVQVYVGKHVPPKAQVVPLKMEEFIQSFNKINATPQEYHNEFETIHPFTDGNGRIGRILWACDLVRRGREVYPILDDYCRRWYMGDTPKRLDTFEECRYNYYQSLSEHNSRK